MEHNLAELTSIQILRRRKRGNSLITLVPSEGDFVDVDVETGRSGDGAGEVRAGKSFLLGAHGKARRALSYRAFVPLRT